MSYFLSKIHKIQSSFRKLGRQPVFDWYFSLALFFILLLVVLISCLIGYIRLGYSDVPIPLTESSSGAQVNFNVASIQKTLDSFEQRRLGAQSVPKSVIIDPSI